MDFYLKFKSKPLTLFSDAVLKLSRLFQIDALTDWTLCHGDQSLNLHCVTLCYKKMMTMMICPLAPGGA